MSLSKRLGETGFFFFFFFGVVSLNEEEFLYFSSGEFE